MTPTEQQFLLWACLTLLGIIGFIGVMAVNALIKMNNNLNDINVTIREIVTKQEDHEEEFKKHDKRIEKLEERSLKRWITD